jgi:putative transposase
LAGVAQGKPVEIWFQDEARIGQKNGMVRQWARRGSRPRQPADQRYDSAYLFGAICPARGTGAGLAMPYADTEAMQFHLDEIKPLRVCRRLLLLRGWSHDEENITLFP